MIDAYDVEWAFTVLLEHFSYNLIYYVDKWEVRGELNRRHLLQYPGEPNLLALSDRELDEFTAALNAGLKEIEEEEAAQITRAACKVKTIRPEKPDGLPFEFRAARSFFQALMGSNCAALPRLSLGG